MKKRMLSEERAALAKKAGKKRATVNAEGLLPPNVFKSKKGYKRWSMDKRREPLVQTWRKDVSALPKSSRELGTMAVT